jgi:hypothetical protein
MILAQVPLAVTVGVSTLPTANSAPGVAKPLAVAVGAWALPDAAIFLAAVPLAVTVGADVKYQPLPHGEPHGGPEL